MSARAWMGVACVAAALPLAAGASTVFKCIAPDGTVTYQELACPDAGGGRAMDVPMQFPPVDTAARDRLFEREAALDKRLEAQRDRLTAESVARLSRPEPVFVASEPAVSVAWPAWGPRPWQGRRTPVPPRGRPVQSMLR